MENPLIASDQSEPSETPASSMERAKASEAKNTPAAKPAPAATPKAKKPFFTTGKIIAIVGIAVVVIAIIGAIFYSQTSQRFQGASFPVAAPPSPEDVTTQPAESVIEEPASLTVLSETTCDAEKGLVDLNGQCVCETSSVYDYNTESCTSNYCALTEGDVKKASGDQYTDPATRVELQAIMADYTNWMDANCGETTPGIFGIVTELSPLTVAITPEDTTTPLLSEGTTLPDITVAITPEDTTTPLLSGEILVLDFSKEIVPGDTTTPPSSFDPQPQNCSSLEITLPSSTDMEITEDFVTTTDKVEFTVTGTDNIANYRVTASNDTLVFGSQDNDVYTDFNTVTLSGGPAVDEPVTIEVQAIDVTGSPITVCKDSITITRAAPADSEPVCRSLSIVAPSEANQAGSPEFLISAGGFVDQPLTVEIDGDQGSWGNVKYNTVSENGDITFDDQASLSTDALTVSMNGIPSGSTETITVWALDPETGSGIAACNDSFTIRVDEDSPPSLTYTPPEEDDGPPTLAYTPPEEDDGPPSLEFTPPEDDRRPGGSSRRITPGQPDQPDPDEPAEPAPHAAAPDEPVEPPAPQPAQPGGGTVAAAPSDLHAAAPSTPQTGPGLIIPLIGVAFGGAWMRRKRKGA